MGKKALGSPETLEDPTLLKRSLHKIDYAMIEWGMSLCSHEENLQTISTQVASTTSTRTTADESEPATPMEKRYTIWPYNI